MRSTLADLTALEVVNGLGEDVVIVDAVSSAVGRQHIFKCPEHKSAVNRDRKKNFNTLVELVSTSTGTVADLTEVSIKGVPELCCRVLNIDLALKYYRINKMKEIMKRTTHHHCNTCTKLKYVWHISHTPW
jgi:hypothetical protein